MSELRSVLSAPATQGAIGEMVDAVAALYRVGASDILGRARTKSVSEARACVYLVARRCTRLSYPEIGRAMDRDHSTVLHGVGKAERLYAADKWFAAAVDGFIEKFGAMREEERMQ
jgi:chromosomal replication initiator protein